MTDLKMLCLEVSPALGTTAPYFNDMDDVGERYARDAKTGERYKLPKDTTYKQWKAMQDAAYGAGTVDKMRKMDYNKIADKAQFEAYKRRLGSDAPRTFVAFQKLKYDNPTAYGDIFGYYRYKGNNLDSNKGLYKANNAVKAMRTAVLLKQKAQLRQPQKGAALWK